jgi:hypothetical protein
VTVKVSLTVNAKRYDIDVEEDFAHFLTDHMKHDFQVDGNNDLRALLQAYVRSNFALYTQEKEMTALADQLQTV